VMYVKWCMLRRVC